MEIIIVLAACGFALWWFFIRDAKTSDFSAPYKVETPTPTPVATPAPEEVIVVENAVAPAAVVEQAPAKPARKPAAKKVATPAKKAAPAKKPAVKKAKAAPSKKV